MFWNISIQVFCNKLIRHFFLRLLYSRVSFHCTKGTLFIARDFYLEEVSVIQVPHKHLWYMWGTYMLLSMLHKYYKFVFTLCHKGINLNLWAGSTWQTSYHHILCFLILPSLCKWWRLLCEIFSLIYCLVVILA